MDFAIDDNVIGYAGIALLAFGWLLYYASIWIAGGVLLGVGGFLLADIAHRYFSIDPFWYAILTGTVAVVATILGGWLSHALHKVGFFVGGFVAGLVGAIIFMTTNLPEATDLKAAMEQDLKVVVVAVIAATVLGILCLVLDWLLIAAAAAALGTALVLRGFDLPPLWAAAIGPGGFLIQIGLRQVLVSSKKGKDDE